MRKLLSIVLVVAFMLWPPIIAGAKDKKKPSVKYKHVKPFTSIQNQIGDLQDQIDNIQLIPGPPRPQGPQGETGPQGPSGQSGGGGFGSIYHSDWGMDKTISECEAIKDTRNQIIAYECVARCNSGDQVDQVISGGYRFDTSTAAGLFPVYGSSPKVFAENEGWAVVVKNDPNSTDATTTRLMVYAVCVGP